MQQWEYCYVHETLTPADDGGLVRDYFIARPDQPENRTDLKENQLLAMLGGEGWELVSVVGLQTHYSDGPTELGGVPTPSHREGSSNTSATMYYFKRPKDLSSSETPAD